MRRHDSEDCTAARLHIPICGRTHDERSTIAGDADFMQLVDSVERQRGYLLLHEIFADVEGRLFVVAPRGYATRILADLQTALGAVSEIDSVVTSKRRKGEVEDFAVDLCW